VGCGCGAPADADVDEWINAELAAAAMEERGAGAAEEEAWGLITSTLATFDTVLSD
jgi:hypothetical protein